VKTLSVRLLCRAAPAHKYPSIGVTIRSPVVDSVFSTITSGLRHGHFSRYAVSSASYQLKRLQSVMNSAVRGRCLHRPSSTTSLHSFISYMTAPEHIQYKLAVLAFKYCKETAPTYTWSMNSSSPRTSGFDPAYDQRRRHHCLSAVHGCQPSVIELFRLPPSYLEHTSAPSIYCSHTSWGVHFLDFCSAC